jgi:hypothetical protein
VDFGEDGRRVEGAWAVARFLLSESHQFRAIGLDSVQLGGSEAIAALGSPEEIATQADEIDILGHTMKLWLGDYASAIRHGSARIRMYFPAADAIGLDLLVASHRIGPKVIDEIARAKQVALEVRAEIGDPDRFQCFELPVKPMFSATVVNRARPDAFMVVDHYAFRVGAQKRPKLIVQGAQTPLFRYYSACFSSVVEQARPCPDL